ncbi:MAG: sugar ABC transporter substrate-binding protein [Planctomycetia bacterium]|nr:sugar ABC transporter substrate-binding protein [Planctomycetia bacterium]
MSQQQPTRRAFLERVAAGAGLGAAAALLPGCSSDTGTSGAGSAASGEKPLRCLFSNAGLISTWCSLGKKTAELWGKLLNVEVVWADGEFDQQKQRQVLDIKIEEDWDFCCFQAVQIDTLEEPVKKLKARGVPVISMDVDIVDRSRWREVGVWMHVTADQDFMGYSSSRYMMEKIGGKGKVIHIGGLSAHTGAQGRKRGFEKALQEFPEVEVVGGGVRWCDWEKSKALDAFTAIINQHDTPIAGAFFHSDDMSLVCADKVKDTIHNKMVITAVDGQAEGLKGVKSGALGATTVNPVCLIHMWALTFGQFIVRNNEPVDSLPLEVIAPGPLVSRESGNLDAMFFLADPRHCLV